MITNLRISLFAVAALVLTMLALYEIGMAYPVAWVLYLAVAIAFVVALMPFASGRFQRARVISLLVILSAVAVLYYMPWTSRKPFLRDLARIRVGMTEAEVRHIMGRYMEGTGMPASPFDSATNSTSLSIVGSSSRYFTTTSPDGEMVIRDSLVYRHSKDGAFNSDWGIVSLSSGRVARVEFSPD